MSEDSQRRRTEDIPLYTQADLDRVREKVQDTERDRQRDSLLSELKGQIAGMPATFEGIARRVFDEQMRAMRTENSSNRWRSADTLIALGQLLIATGVVVLAIWR